MEIQHAHGSTYLVRRNREYYIVDAKEQVCDCKCFKYRRKCVHLKELNARIKDDMVGVAYE